MTAKSLALLAAAGSAALLLGAFAFQAAGYAPCQMCLWQRWPHGVAIGAGILVLVAGAWLFLWALVGALAALTTAGLGIYHTGVERDWWEGPTTCSGSAGASGFSGADLLSTEGTSDIVPCDEVAWAFAGLSMASWNALFSVALAVLWVVALRRWFADRS